jgi:hypothetical protein
MILKSHELKRDGIGRAHILLIEGMENTCVAFVGKWERSYRFQKCGTRLDNTFRMDL